MTSFAVSVPSRRPSADLLLAGLSLVASVLVLPAALLAQAPPGDFDEGLFDLTISRELSTTVLVLQNPRGEILVPLLPILQLTEISFERVGAIRLLIQRTAGTVVVDGAAQMVESLDSTFAVDSDRLVAAYEDLYLPGSIVGDLLGAEVEVDFGALALRLARDPPFPAEIRLQRDRERGRAERVAGRVLGERDQLAVSVPYPATTGPGTLEWGVTASGTDGLPNSGSVRARLGLAVLGGELFVGGRLGVSDLQEFTPAAEGLFSYRRVFPENRWIQQLQLGDLLTQGIRHRSVTGAQISNVPVVRDRRFDDVLLDPDLPDGWQYEVYQGGILMGASDRDAMEPVRVPLGYGSTPLRIRYLGPQGEEQVVEITHYIPIGQLPSGRTEYALGAGACRGQRCDWMATADLRHGLTSRLTLGGGLEMERDSAQADHWRPYGAVSALPLRNLLVEASMLPGGFARGGVRYSQSPRSHLSAEGGVERPGFRTGSILPEETDRWFGRLEGRAPLPDGVGPIRSLRASLRTEGRMESASPTRVRASVGGGVRGGYLEIRHERSDLQPEAITAVRGTSSALARHPSLRAFRPVASAGLGASRSGLAQVEGGVTLSLTDRIRLRTAGSWTRGTGPPRLSIGLNTETNGARLRTGVTTGTATRTTASADGVLSYGRESGLRADARRGAGLAGVEGRVFHDRTGDGVFREGDEPVANIPVVVGGRRVVTDEAGRYRAWGLRPYEIAIISVDSARVPDPTWLPAQHAFPIRPVPNVYTRLDIPLSRTREVIGRLVPDPGLPTPGGVTLLLVNEAGEETLRAQTFSDGGYYIPRVRPGRYELRIAESSLRALRAVPAPDHIEFVVPAEGDDPIVELADIRLARAEDAIVVPQAARIHGRLVSAVTGGPVQGEVEARHVDVPEATRTSITGDDGRFSIDLSTGGTVRLTGRATGYGDVMVESRAGEQVELALTPLVVDSVRIPFAFDRATLGPAGTAAVQRAARLAMQSTGPVDIRGHTDSVGADAYNHRLSIRRAETVASILEELGVLGDRLTIRAFGSDEPIASNQTREGKASNRRVEVFIVIEGPHR